MVRIALVLCAVTGAVTGLGAGSARAEERAEDVVRLDVAVGETIEQDVGFAIGLRCDDLTIIRAELRASTPESNTFSGTGVQQGTTMCRVGTVPSRPTYLFEIHVVAPRHRR